MIDEHNEIVLLHRRSAIERDGQFGAFPCQRLDSKIDVVKRSFDGDKAIGDSRSIERIVFLACGGQSQEISWVDLQIKREILEPVMIDPAFHGGLVAQGVGEHHILKRNGFVVDEYGGLKSIECVQIVDFTAAVDHFDFALYDGSLQRPANIYPTIAITLHPRHNTHQERTEGHQTKRIQRNGEIEIIFLFGIVHAIHVQHSLVLVEDVGIHFHETVFVVP